MTNLTTSIKFFTSLSRAPGAVWTEATKRKAPHKPLLLLAVLVWCSVALCACGAE